MLCGGKRAVSYARGQNVIIQNLSQCGLENIYKNKMFATSVGSLWCILSYSGKV